MQTAVLTEKTRWKASSSGLLLLRCSGTSLVLVPSWSAQVHWNQAGRSKMDFDAAAAVQDAEWIVR